LSEVDLTDLEDLKVRVNDPAGDVLVELGSSDYLKRYRIYVSHVQAWRQQFQKLQSVNLRYDNQVIVNPDMEGRPKQAALSGTAAKAAEAAGVKPAALVSQVGPRDRAVPRPAFEMSPKKLETKSSAGRKPAAKTKTRKPMAKAGKSIAARKALTKAREPVPKGAPRAGARELSQKSVAWKSAPPAKPAAAVPKPSPAIAKQANTSPN